MSNPITEAYERGRLGSTARENWKHHQAAEWIEAIYGFAWGSDLVRASYGDNAPTQLLARNAQEARITARMAARELLERARAFLGPLWPIIKTCVMEGRSPTQWARDEGLPNATNCGMPILVYSLRHLALFWENETAEKEQRLAA